MLFVLYKYVICTVYVLSAQMNHSIGSFYFTFAVFVVLLNCVCRCGHCDYLSDISCHAFMHLFLIITILEGINCIANYMGFHIY